MWTYCPNWAWKALTVLGGIGAPPDQILVIEASASLGSSLAASGAFISAMNTVIDPTVKVARSSRIVSSITEGSNR